MAAVAAIVEFCSRYPDASLKHIHLVDIQPDIISLYQGRLEKAEFQALAGYDEWTSWLRGPHHSTTPIKENEPYADRTPDKFSNHQQVMIVTNTTGLPLVTSPRDDRIGSEATSTTAVVTDLDKEYQHRQTPNVSSKPAPRAYRKLNGDAWVYAWRMDITKMKIDVVVNAANERLSHDDG